MPNEVEENSDSQEIQQAGKKKWIACSILLLVNLLNYMDRFTIVGIMDRLKIHFDLDQSQQGLLQTVFIVFYMIFAPLFGYLGDRFNRKMLMMVGVSIWIVAVFASSFCEGNHWILFLLCRGIVGTGEASYSTLAPTILSDLFSGAMRSRVLMIFYFAIPVGSGLGFISGANIALATDSWQWGVRLTPIIGIACLLLMFFFLEEPVRGACDGARQSGDQASLLDDLKYLLSVKTFIFVSAASVAVFFSVGTMSWWTPPFIGYAYAVTHGKPKVPEPQSSNIAFIFGIITALSGLLGVATGSILSRAWRDGKSIFKNRASEKADVYICAISMFVAIPFFFSAVLLAEYSITICYVLIYFAIMSMCLTWSVNVDILMYVVVANRRATALAVQTMVAHMFGDAASPYIIGFISDRIRQGDESMAAYFFAMQKALYIPTFVLVIAGAFYLAATFFVEEDRKEALFLMEAPDVWSHPNMPGDMDALIYNSDTVDGIEEEHPSVVNTTSSQQQKPNVSGDTATA